MDVRLKTTVVKTTSRGGTLHSIEIDERLCRPNLIPRRIDAKSRPWHRIHQSSTDIMRKGILDLAFL